MTKDAKPAFKRGQQVKFKTIHGRKGAGKIKEIVPSPRGDWYHVVNDVGVVTRVRLAALQAAA